MSFTQFDYLLNAFEQASQSPEPAKMGYGGKRRALLAYVNELESRASVPETQRSDVKPSEPDENESGGGGTPAEPLQSLLEELRIQCSWLTGADYSNAMTLLDRIETALHQPAEPLPDEREAFEKWAVLPDGGGRLPIQVARQTDGVYWDPELWRLWQCWLARAALHQSETPTREGAPSSPDLAEIRKRWDDDSGYDIDQLIADVSGLDPERSTESPKEGRGAEAPRNDDEFWYDVARRQAAKEGQGAEVPEPTDRQALRELVACKDLKESLPPRGTWEAMDAKAKHDEYLRRQPLAWEAARRALAVERTPQPAPETVKMVPLSLALDVLVEVVGDIAPAFADEARAIVSKALDSDEKNEGGGGVERAAIQDRADDPPFRF